MFSTATKTIPKGNLENLISEDKKTTNECFVELELHQDQEDLEHKIERVKIQD